MRQFVTRYSLTEIIFAGMHSKTTMMEKQSPLRGISIGSTETVAIREIPGIPAIDLRVKLKTPGHSAVEKALGFHLPDKTGQYTTMNAWAANNLAYVLCLGPDWWILVGLQEAGAQLQLLRSLSEHHFSVVDVTGQRTTIELSGAAADQVLSHLWDQDLRVKNFPVSGVSQGMMAKAPVIVYRTGASRYRVMVRSSFALHLWTALTDAAEEYISGPDY